MLGFRSKQTKITHNEVDLHNSPLGCSVSDLAALRALGQNLPLKQFRRILAQRPGHHGSPFFGRGTDYESSRQYLPRDDVRAIDWRMSARRDELYVKVHREERERPILILLDQSSSMHFATRGALKSVRATQSAALLAWAACAQSERFGCWCLGSDELKEALPKTGEEALANMFAQINFTAPEKTVFDSRQAHYFDAAIHRLQQRAVFGSLVFILSDFYQLSDTVAQRFIQLGQHSDVVLILFYDEMEKSLPADEYCYLSDGNDFIAVDAHSAKNQQLYAESMLTRLKALEYLKKQKGIMSFSMRTDESPLNVLADKLIQEARDPNIEKFASSA
ncbi:MAG TPA: hypothetical protein DCZ03_02090 [Gammaproteobacteria bacterium]|nr:hypothetical protein [Gammaproteobacteria bacterium]